MADRYIHSYPSFPYEKFGYTHETWRAEPLTHTLIMCVARRYVEHDGYCSDAGEDVGEFKFTDDSYRIVESLAMRITLGDVKLAFDDNELGCQIGSGYCGYNGQIKVIGMEVHEDAFN